MARTEESTRIVDVEPTQLRDWLSKGDAVIVDVREDFEHASERIAGSHLHPLSAFNAEEIRQRHGEKRIIFQCRTGNRSRKAATQYSQTVGADAKTFHLAGGIEAWKAAGFEVDRAKSAPRIDVMRQVQMVAGSLVLVGVILGVTVSPYFLILSGFVGGGLLFAGASGYCGMAMLLGKMPWNRCSK